MASNRADCIEHLPEGKHPKIAVRDPGTGQSVILLNPQKKHARRIHVDGCLVPQQTAADFILSLDAVIDLIVELKGKNVKHGIEQVEATRAFWVHHPKHAADQPIGAFIVCKEVPAPLILKRAQERLRAQSCVLKTAKSKEERAFTEFLPQR